MGSTGAAKGSLARERTLRTELAHRLDAAVSAHDPRTVATIAAVSRQVGWARLARRATRAREAQGAGAIAEVSGIAVNGSRARPVFGWQAPAAAARYQVVVLDAAHRPYWAWQGAEVAVRVGGGAPPHARRTA